MQVILQWFLGSSLLALDMSVIPSARWVRNHTPIMWMHMITG